MNGTIKEIKTKSDGNKFAYIMGSDKILYYANNKHLSNSITYVYVGPLRTLVERPS